MSDDMGKEVGKISIRVVPNLQKFWRELKEKMEEVEKSLEAEVKVVPKMDGFREKINAETKGMETQVKVKADLDQSEFSRTLAEVKAAAKAAGLNIKVDFRDTEAEAKLAGLIERLKAEARLAKIDLKVGLDRRNALGESRGNGIGSVFGSLGAAAGSSISAMKDQTVMIIVAVIALLAPALSLLSQALVGLPALVAAVAIPLGTLALGLGGIKKALEDVGLASIDKKGKLGIGDVLKSLQQPINDVFEKGFVPVFEKIISLAPTLSSALPKVAQGIVDLATGVTNALTSAVGQSNIQHLIGNIGQMLTNMGPGFESFTGALLKMTTVVSNHLPGLGDWLTGWADKFAAWVDKISQPGTAVGGGSILDSAISQLRPILDSIMSFVGRLMDAGLKLASNPGETQNIVKTIQGLTNFIVNGLPVLEKVFAMVAGLIDKIGQLSKMGGFANLLSGKGGPDGALTGLGPFNSANGNPFAEMGTVFDTVLKPKLQQFIVEATIQFSQLWNTVASLAGVSWDTIVTEAKSALSGLISTALTIVTGIVSAFMSLPGQIGNVWSGISTAASAALSGLVGLVANIVSGIVTEFVSTGFKIMAEVGSWPGKIEGALAGLFQAGVTAGTQLVQGFIQGIGSLIGAAVAKAHDLAGQVTSAVTSALGIKSPSTVFADIGSNTAQGFQQGLEGGFQGVVDRAKALAQQVSDAMAQGVNPAGMKDQIAQQLKDLQLESDQLRVQRDALGKKDPQRKVLSDQLSQIGATRDQLELQRDQLGLSKQQGNQNNQILGQLNQVFQGSMSAGTNFAMANVKQFESDIGISGNGAIPQLAQQGIGFLTQTIGQLASGLMSGALGGGGTHYHVNSVDDAMALDRTNRAKESMQYVGR